MERFIYVVGEEARDRLVNMGYRLLREGNAKNIYVYLSQDNQNFSCTDIQFAMSDTLTFYPAHLCGLYYAQR